MKTYNCICCNKISQSRHGKRNKFCSIFCQHEQGRKDLFQRLQEGQVKAERSTLRKLLIWKFGLKCFECGLSEWRGNPIPLELDHIDGNATNNTATNLRNVCPNCHAITPSWKGRNKGKGRKSLGISLS